MASTRRRLHRLCAVSLRMRMRVAVRDGPAITSGTCGTSNRLGGAVFRVERYMNERMFTPSGVTNGGEIYRGRPSQHVLCFGFQSWKSKREQDRAGAAVLSARATCLEHLFQQCMRAKIGCIGWASALKGVSGSKNMETEPSSAICTARCPSKNA